MSKETMDEIPEDQKHHIFRIIATTLCFITVLLCLISILSMTIPLLSNERRKQYSSFNLYLVFLFIPDLCFSVCKIVIHLTWEKWMYINSEEQIRMDPPFDSSIYIGCLVADLYTNAFIAYEIYTLLLCSNQMKHHNPPSLLRVTIQASISYSIAIIASLINGYFFDGHEMRHKVSVEWKIVYVVCCYIFFIGVPVSCLFYVCFRIWYNKLFPPDTLYGGRLRILALYFAKIIFVGMMVAILCAIALGLFMNITNFNHSRNPETDSAPIITLLSVILSITSFALSLTKPDVCKLVVDFLTFQYCKCELCSSWWHKLFVCCSSKQSQLQLQQQQQQSDDIENDTIVDEELSGLRFDHYLQTDETIHSSISNQNNSIRNINRSTSNEKMTTSANIIMNAGKESNPSKFPEQKIESINNENQNEYKP